MGVSDSLLSWIGSYLQNRTQTVKLGTYESRAISVTSGIPERSHLGLLLFTVFVNDDSRVYDKHSYSWLRLYREQNFIS